MIAFTIEMASVLIAVGGLMGYTLRHDLKDARAKGHTIHPLFTRRTK